MLTKLAPGGFDWTLPGDLCQGRGTLWGKPERAERANVCVDTRPCVPAGLAHVGHAPPLPRVEILVMNLGGWKQTLSNFLVNWMFNNT